MQALLGAEATWPLSSFLELVVDALVKEAIIMSPLIGFSHCVHPVRELLGFDARGHLFSSGLR